MLALIRPLAGMDKMYAGKVFDFTKIWEDGNDYKAIIPDIGEVWFPDRFLDFNYQDKIYSSADVRAILEKCIEELNNAR